MISRTVLFFATALTLSSNAFAYTKTSDIVYDKVGSTSLKMDMYAGASSSTLRPALLHFHGGCFSGGSKTSVDSTIKSLADSGVVVFSIDYRLSGVAKYPAAVTDVQQALRYIRKNASKFGIDPKKIATHGESAGGYLAAVLGVRKSPTRTGAMDAYSERVQIVSNWYGRTDFTMSQTSGKDCAASFLGLARNATNMPKFAEASILPYVDANSSKFQIFHGTEDTQVVPIHSSKLASKLWSLNKSAVFTLVEGAPHDFRGGTAWTLTRRAILSEFGIKDTTPLTNRNAQVTSINAGQPSSGKPIANFLSDRYYSGGAPVSTSSRSIDNTKSDALYYDRREGQTFAYSLPASSGVYQLDLWFAETNSSVKAGSNSFDVYFDDVPALLDFDILKNTKLNTVVNRNLRFITRSSQVRFSFNSKSQSGKASVSALRLSQIPY